MLEERCEARQVSNLPARRHGVRLFNESFTPKC